MDVFDATTDLRSALSSIRKKNQTIGLVPTMGALHDGHLSLLEASKQENQVSVCTIFINPVQFNNPEDLKKYPKSLDADLNELERNGCDIVFCPGEKEMYPHAPQIYFDTGVFGAMLEGKYRPGHFNGVLLVVAKLLNIIQPDRAYFGQKDLQQYLLIERMVRDLSYPVEVKALPTIRETSGLAMSSRNRRLSPVQLEQAASLHQALCQGKDQLMRGQPFSEVRQSMENYLRNFADVKPEYIELLDLNILKPAEKWISKDRNGLLLAAYVGQIRLIDNLIF